MSAKSRPLSDASTGWSFDYLTDASGDYPPPGGLVLKSVRHQQHNMAKDLRLIGLRLKVKELDPSGKVVRTFPHFLALTDPPFTPGKIQILSGKSQFVPRFPLHPFRFLLQEGEEALQYRTFFRPAATGLRVDYKLASDYFEKTFPNCEMSSLTLSQRVLFSRYSNVPPHEPSGSLVAARCHPLVKYELTPNAKLDPRKNRHRIESLRFDYRLHLVVDRHYDVEANAWLPPLGNNAALTRDNDFINAPGALGGLSGGLSGAFTGSTFAAVEKPVVKEVVAPGLSEGLTTLGTRTLFPPAPDAPKCWDNLHWWGSRGPGAPIISAPGAFHAIHLHWRWGGAGSSVPFARVKADEIDTGGVPEAAQEHPWAFGSTRTLVDPEIWIQTIRVAVARHIPSRDPERTGVTLESLSKDDWQTLFTGTTPSNIYDGADIVLWYSTEVHRSTTVPTNILSPQTGPATIDFHSGLSGTVFLHGLYFAHDAEQTGLTVGSTRPEHKPRTLEDIRNSTQWERPA